MVETEQNRAGAGPPLLRNRGFWLWSLAVLAYRLPATMAPLAFTVLTTATLGSYRFGATMVAAYVAGELVGAVPAGRLLDAIGPRRGLRLLLPLSGGVLAATWVAARAGARPEALLVLVVICGIASGGLAGGFRSLLADTVSETRLPRATSIDAMATDGVILTGPLLVVALTTTGPTVPLLVMSLALLLSAACVTGDPRAERTGAPAARTSPPPRYWGRAVPWLACLFAIGHLLSTVEVAPLPLAARVGGQEGTAALLVGTLCAASVAGGTAFAWRGRASVRTAIGCLTCFVVGGVLVAFDLGRPGLLCGVALIGACTAPLLSVAVVQLQQILPEPRRAAGFSVAFVVQSSGFGLGSLAVAALPLTVAVLAGALSAFAVMCALAVRSHGAATGASRSGSTPTASHRHPAAPATPGTPPAPPGHPLP